MSSLPWFIPLLWPEANVIATVNIASRDGKGTHDTYQMPSLPVAHPTCGIKEHLTACVAGTRSFLMALFFVYVVHGGTDPLTGYPAFGRAKTLDWSWTIPLFVRNILGTWLIAGGWDWYVKFLLWLLDTVDGTKIALHSRISNL